ncbi:MAG: WD40 repeat domain-containing protein, partial [Verrucomicrobiota bacterium]
MAPDINLRYDNVGALAGDIQHYLNAEPILARPPSTAYRVRKYVERNRLAASFMATIALFLIGAFAAALWSAAFFREQEQVQRDLALRADTERDTAVRNRYFADMRLAADDLAAGQVARVTQILDRYLPESEETDIRGWEWYYLLGQCRQDLFTIRTSANSPHRLNWSPDGRRLLFGPLDGQQLLDAESGNVLWAISEYRAGQATAWSPDGRYFAHPSPGSRIVIRDGETGALIHSVRTRVQSLQAMAWSPDGWQLALLNKSGLYLFDLHTGKTSELAKPGFPRRTGLSWMTQTHTLFCHDTVYDVKSGNHRPVPQKGAWFTSRLSPDQQTLAVVRNGRIIERVDRTTGTIEAGRDFDRAVLDVDWTADGRFLAVGS